MDKNLRISIIIILIAIPLAIISLYPIRNLKGFFLQRDYTYEFNNEREKLRIPKLSKDWIPRFKNRMKYETQYWDNNIRDTVNPNYFNPFCSLRLPNC